jgi:hypothetical protein
MSCILSKVQISKSYKTLHSALTNYVQEISSLLLLLPYHPYTLDKEVISSNNRYAFSEEKIHFSPFQEPIADRPVRSRLV